MVADRSPTRWLPVLLLSVSCLSARSAEPDTDRDGMPDALEQRLGTLPQLAEKLEEVATHATYKPTPERLARWDITRVRFGNVAKGRWLWAIEFAEPFETDNSSVILYVDADSDPSTGREKHGCEAMYFQRTRGASGFASDGGSTTVPPARIGVANGVLYLCADLDLKQVDGRSRHRIMILSQSIEPFQARDSMRYTEIDGPGDSERPKPVMLADTRRSVGFEVTQNAAQLWGIRADKRNVILNSFRDCELRGFAYYQRQYRWPAVNKKGGKGTIAANAPGAGTFHVGAVVYDADEAQVYEMAVDGTRVGRFVARERNRRQRLFFSSKPVTFKGGERIVLTGAATGARYVVEDVVLLAERPAVLESAREIQHLEIGYDWVAGCMRATWRTTWPVVCELRCGETVIKEETARENHRLYLPELAPGTTYTCTIQPEGGNPSESVSFVAGEPQAPRGTVAHERTMLTILAEKRSIPAGYPLTAGVPFPRGALGSTEHLRLLAPDGSEMPLQVKPLVRWPDHSMKAVLLDTMAPSTPGPLTLEYGTGVSRGTIGPVVHVAEDAGVITVATPSLKMRFDKQRSGLFTHVWVGDQLMTRDDRPARVVVVDDAGKEFDTLGVANGVVVEESGPLRAVVRLDGHHTNGEAEFFTYQIRFTFCAGLPGVRMSYRWGNDVSANEMTRFRGIRLTLPLSLAEDAEVALGGDEPMSGRLADGPRLEQLHDDRYSVTPRTLGVPGRRTTGWVAASDGRQRVALLPRWFWQLYPKAVQAGPEGLRLDICPEFSETQYNDCSAIDLVKLYYYLQDGRYKVRQGVTKTHEAVLLFGSTGPLWTTETLDELAGLLNASPVMAASPEWYVASGFMDVDVPSTGAETQVYDDICEKTCQAWLANQKRQHAYGMLNYGDRFGERKVNWANGESDDCHAAAIMFTRTGSAEAFRLMETMARHDIDVDLCHYHTISSRRGASWIHSMGHTGGYFQKAYEGKWGSPRGGMTVSHTWCGGTCETYMLTGDPTALEAARMIADRYGGTYLNHYDWPTARVPGWHLLLTMAVYRTTYDPYYLNAARIIADRVLERRTPGGGWDRQLVPGHCHCTPRCRGACSFMIGVLGYGLREYYLETQDERMPQAMQEAGHWLIREMWDEDREAFRYTSCPVSNVSAARSVGMSGPLIFAHELTGDTRLLELAERALRASLPQQRSIRQLRWVPYIVHTLNRLGRDSKGIWGQPDPDALAKLSRGGLPAGKIPEALKGATIVQAEAFTAQGGGEVGVFQRPGSVGAMISRWHADIGHWLEWTFTVPREGDYTLLIRYASGGTAPRRSLTIDGASPGREYEDIAFKPTGGYCMGADNWASHTLSPPVRLQAGSHRLRMANLDDGLALDYIAIREPK
ncbi:MAG: hypothetical protein HN742_32215 [Lentisphaerae bacterium]|jgi:hypothetical protein|nr:hypothetical protein [Lentisphaerota bacterium]MBT4819570.1 hypothetical protein [Lentisphaerota bacterium]MBT7846579.1 hypothetical protein [Lentisphaerota bacterium]